MQAPAADSGGNDGGETANQGLTLVHISAQCRHLVRETLGSAIGSGTKNVSGSAEKWTSLSPCRRPARALAAAAVRASGFACSGERGERRRRRRQSLDALHG